ncbi:hypothetical protein POM88_022767 [Heracleum sosnowskyi]|uniref:Uncharacterized protein n=1 Tax=Heracleum sosnowskyi TaxID=360622 RepID=A0AAD8IIH6_9APIA|nr:hypothetical protein POM88_022767 [Heracleum sosnowskyi]
MRGSRFSPAANLNGRQKYRLCENFHLTKISTLSLTVSTPLSTLSLSDSHSQPSLSASLVWASLIRAFRFGASVCSIKQMIHQIDIKYLKNVNKGTICELELDEDKVKQFKEPIENSYWFEFFMEFEVDPLKSSESEEGGAL